MMLPYIKMNGSGNDFVIFDGRQEKIALLPAQIREIAHRENAVTGGCDQVIIMENTKEADVFMRIYNADGGEVNACGNATRCIASLMEEELQKLPVSIQTNAAILHGVNKAYTPDEEEFILVDMGAPKFEAVDIPLALSVDETKKALWQLTPLPLGGRQGGGHSGSTLQTSSHPNGEGIEPVFVSMGNPHVVFFLRFEPTSDGARDDEPLFDLDFETIGPSIERAYDLFPAGVNVSIALLRMASDGDGHIIHARVWERGAGLTEACGTAACAMLAAANQLDSSINNVHVWFEPFGTNVTVQLNENGHVLLGGPIEIESKGNVPV